MVQPIQYQIPGALTPFENLVSGLNLGTTMANMDVARAQQEAQIQLAQQKAAAEQAAMQRAQQYQEGMSKVLANPKRTWTDFEPLLALAPNKDQIDAIKTMAERSDKQVAQAQQNFTSNVLLALEVNPDVAKKLLDERIAASEDQQQKQFLQTLRSAVDISPKTAANMIELGGASMYGKDWYEGITKVRNERRAEAKAPSELRQAVALADKAVADATTAQATATNAAEKAAADAALAKAQADKAKIDAQYAGPLAQANLNLNAAQIKNINSEIGTRAAKLKLDTQTMQATVAEKLSSIQKNLNELPADTRKLINESAVTAAASKQLADQYNDLAKRLEAEGGGYGVFSSASDFLKKGVGFQGGMTQLRQEYTRLRNTAAIKSLPPGPATDKDIAMALKGFPGDNAAATDLAAFLRGMAKLQDIEASVANSQTDWLANNNGVLTRAKNTFQAGDYATKPGESFNDFTQRIVQDVSKRYNPTTQTPLVEQIPTDRNPNPAAQSANIRSQADAILRGGK